VVPKLLEDEVGLGAGAEVAAGVGVVAVRPGADLVFRTGNVRTGLTLDPRTVALAAW
jgi:hypothetical protein